MGSFAEYPKMVTSPAVGAVIVKSRAQEEAVLAGTAVFRYTKDSRPDMLQYEVEDVPEPIPEAVFEPIFEPPQDEPEPVIAPKRKKKRH